MFHSSYCLFIMNMIRLGEKMTHQKVRRREMINFLKIKKLEITFRIPSEIQFEHGFIAMLMLTEKMLNHKPIFLLDKNTLSKKRTIKVGLVITIKDELIDDYLALVSSHSVPKFYDYGISFSVSSKDQPFIYKLSKILSNTLFSFDKDINSYYAYLGDLEYEFEFLFRTYFKSVLMNKLIATSRGIHFVDLIDINTLTVMDEAEKQSEIEEFDEAEELKKSGNIEEEEEFNFSDSDEFDESDFSDESYENEEYDEYDESDEFNESDEDDESDEFDESYESEDFDVFDEVDDSDEFNESNESEEYNSSEESYESDESNESDEEYESEEFYKSVYSDEFYEYDSLDKLSEMIVDKDNEEVGEKNDETEEEILEEDEKEEKYEIIKYDLNEINYGR